MWAHAGCKKEPQAMLQFIASVVIGAGPLYYPAITSTRADGNGYIESFVQRKGLAHSGTAIGKANHLARLCNHDGSDACALNNPEYQEYLLKVIIPH